MHAAQNITTCCQIVYNLNDVSSSITLQLKIHILTVLLVCFDIICFTILLSFTAKAQVQLCLDNQYSPYKPNNTKFCYNHSMLSRVTLPMTQTEPKTKHCSLHNMPVYCVMNENANV